MAQDSVSSNTPGQEVYSFEDSGYVYKRVLK